MKNDYVKGSDLIGWRFLRIFQNEFHFPILTATILGVSKASLR